MPRYIVERQIPGSGAYTTRTFQKIAVRLCNAIKEMGHGIQWTTSFVTADKWFCVYIAPDEQTIREHAKHSGLLITGVYEVMSVVDPVVAEDGLPDL